MGIIGICLIVGVSAFEGLSRQLIPQLAIIAATACYAGAAIYGRSFKGLSPAAPAAGSLMVGAALLAPLSLAVDHPWTLHASMQSFMALVALAVFSTALAFKRRAPWGIAVWVSLVGTGLRRRRSRGDDDSITDSQAERTRQWIRTLSQLYIGRCTRFLIGKRSLPGSRRQSAY